MSVPLVCTVDNAIDVFQLGMVAGGAGVAIVFGVLLIISKWNSL